MDHYRASQLQVRPVSAIHFGAVTTRGERIRRARNLKGWDQKRLSQLTGVSVRTIGRIEAAKSARSPAIPRLERALGIEPDEVEAQPAPRAEVRLSEATRLELLHELLRRELEDQRAAGVVELPRERLGWSREGLPSGGDPVEGGTARDVE